MAFAIRMVSAMAVVLLQISVVLAENVPGPYVAVQVDYYAAAGEAADAGRGTKVSEGRGSGVVVGSGQEGTWFVLTNAHVVESETESWTVVPRVYAGGQWRAGVIVATDAKADLALLEVAYAKPLRAVEIARVAPDDEAAVETHGFAAGRKYTARETKLTYSLPLDDGAQAFAPQRYFLRTTFMPGESGGAVTINDQLVGLIHGNDPAAERGICVDYPAIDEFLAPHLPSHRTASLEQDSP